MKRIVLLALFLGGCDNMPKAWTEADIRAMARQEQEVTTDILLTRIKQLEADVEAANKAADIANAQARLSGIMTDSLRETVNQNADASNSNSLREMTRRGACGQRTIYRQEGDPPSVPAVRVENITCTKADMRK